MKHLTRILSLLIALTMLLSLAACSGSTKDKTPGTVTDHFGNTVTLPSEINRIVVCDIYPLPSVLAVFFDSAEKIVGMSGPSMTAAQNSLLSELYPEILDAKTDFIDGTTLNIEELMKLEPDLVFYGGRNGSKSIGHVGIVTSVDVKGFYFIHSFVRYQYF